MVIAALVTFAALLIAWLLAPTEASAAPLAAATPDPATPAVARAA